MSSDCLVAPDESQANRRTLDALSLQCNLIKQQYKKITSQIYTKENQEELEEQERIKNTTFSALTEEEKAGYGRLKTVDFEKLSESNVENQKVLHHNTFKQLCDSNLIRIIPANYLMDNRDPAMKNIHNSEQNLILNQNADQPNKTVYYATKDAFVISERLIIKGKTKPIDDRLLFVREGLRHNIPVYYYKRYRVLTRNKYDGYHRVSLLAKDTIRSGTYEKKERVGAIIFTVFSGRSRKEANQGGLRHTLDHITRNRTDDSFCYLTWASDSEQSNNQRKKRKRSVTHEQYKPKANEQDLAKEKITHFFRKHPTLPLLISHIHPTYIFDIENRKFLNGNYYTNIPWYPRRFITYQKKPYQVSRLAGATKIGRELEQGEIVDHINGNTINDSWDQIAITYACGNIINTEESRIDTGHRGIWQGSINSFRVCWTQGHPFERETRYKYCATFEDAIEFRNLMYAEHMLPQVTDGRALNVAWNTYVEDQQKQIAILRSKINPHSQQQEQLSKIIAERRQQQQFLNDRQNLPYPNYHQSVVFLENKRRELKHQLQQHV